VQQASEISAWRHANAGPGLFNRACSANALAGFQNQNTLPGTRQISGAGKSVMAAADD
jgi:hypothetical protein